MGFLVEVLFGLFIVYLLLYFIMMSPVIFDNMSKKAKIKRLSNGEDVEWGLYNIISTDCRNANKLKIKISAKNKKVEFTFLNLDSVLLSETVNIDEVEDIFAEYGTTITNIEGTNVNVIKNQGFMPNAIFRYLNCGDEKVIVCNTLHKEDINYINDCFNILRSNG